MHRPAKVPPRGRGQEEELDRVLRLGWPGTCPSPARLLQVEGPAHPHCAKLECFRDPVLQGALGRIRLSMSTRTRKMAQEEGRTLVVDTWQSTPSSPLLPSPLPIPAILTPLPLHRMSPSEPGFWEPPLPSSLSLGIGPQFLLVLPY